MSYLQAFVIALVQGVTELFPVSSLGHSVLIPAWIGGSWQTLVTQSSQASSETSFYLAYIVALHCATALALLWFFRADWARIIRGFFRSLLRSLRERHLAIEGTDERLAWMIVLATIPVGLTGVALEHTFRTIFAKPAAAAVFLFINGLVLLAAERLRRARPPGQVPAEPVSAQAGNPPGAHAKRAGGRQLAEIRAAQTSDAQIARLSFRDSLYVGLLQITALFAGISRSGITMAGGLWRGLDHEDAARFAFLLATPPDPGRRGPQAPLPGRNRRRAHPRPDPARRRGHRHHRLPLSAVPAALLPDPHPHPIRHLLPRPRRRQHHPLRHLTEGQHLTDRGSRGRAGHQGPPWTRADLRRRGRRHGCQRVARLMRRAGCGTAPGAVNDEHEPVPGLHFQDVSPWRCP